MSAYDAIQRALREDENGEDEVFLSPTSDPTAHSVSTATAASKSSHSFSTPSSLNALVTSLRESVLEMHSLCDHQRRDLARTEELAVDRRAAVNASRGRIAELRTNVQLLREEASHLEAQRAQRDRHTSEVHGRRSTLRQTQRAELEAVRAAHDKLHMELVAATRDLERGQIRRKDEERFLMKEIEDLKFVQTEAKSALDVARAELKDIEAKTQRLAASADSPSEHGNEDARFRASEQQAMLNDIKAVAAQREAEVYASSEATVATLGHEAKALRMALQRIRTERVAIEGETAEIEAELDALLSENDANPDTASQIKDAEGTIARAQAEALRHQAQASQLKETVEQKTAVLESRRRCAQRNEQVSSQVSEAQSELSRTRARVAEYAMECETLDRELAEISTKNDADVAQHEAHMRRLNDETQEIEERLGGTINRLDGERAALENECDALREEFDHLQQQVRNRREALMAWSQEKQRRAEEAETRRRHAVKLLDKLLDEL